MRALVDPLLGIPSWQVTNFNGSMLLIEFGAVTVEFGATAERPTRLTGGPPVALHRPVQVRGEWTLSVEMCDWSIRLGDRTVATCETVDPTMARVLKLIKGQALADVVAAPVDGATEFRFDLGAVLRLAPGSWPDDEPHELWTLRTPEDRYVAVRDDGTYSVRAGDDDGDAVVWHDLTR
jgi:hypothetical protein